MNQQLAELGTAPVSAAQPCGQSARYEPEFEQLEAELAKQESLTPSAVDWSKVVELSTTILQSKSKDLLVAAYLCRGLMETQRYAGLAQGLQVLRDLSQKHWEGLFPELKRMRARATAISWLAEKTGKQVRDTRPKPNEKDAVTQAAALLKELDQALVDKMGQDAPALTDLSRPLKDHVQNLETPPAAAKLATASPAAARPAAAAPAEIAEVLNDADAKKALRQMQELARKVTKYWLAKDVTDARAYRLGRTAGWLTVEAAPANTDGQTQIPAPAPEKLKQLETQRQAGQLEALLPELESTLAKSPYWLDGQKLAADVLEAMGERGAAAHKTVLRELANFNAAVPGLAELKFLGGKPFAEDGTRQWIAEQASGAAQPSGGKRAKAEAEPWEDAFNNARAAATAGNVDGAVKQLTDGFNATASAHEQFMWRLALAQLLVQTGHANVAAPLLESLTARIEEFCLREWEPELAVRVYKLLLTAYDKSTGKAKSAPEVAARAAHAFSALSSLDPAIALNVKL